MLRHGGNPGQGAALRRPVCLAPPRPYLGWRRRCSPAIRGRVCGRACQGGPPPEDRAALVPAASCWLFHDADDAFHAELSVLAAILGVHEAGQHPVAGAGADYFLLVGAPAGIASDSAATATAAPAAIDAMCFNVPLLQFFDWP